MREQVSQEIKKNFNIQNENFQKRLAERKTKLIAKRSINTSQFDQDESFFISTTNFSAKKNFKFDDEANDNSYVKSGSTKDS